MDKTNPMSEFDHMRGEQHKSTFTEAKNVSTQRQDEQDLETAVHLLSGCVSEMSHRFDKLQQYSAVMENVEKEQKEILSRVN